jgi:hypothetical protein
VFTLSGHDTCWSPRANILKLWNTERFSSFKECDKEGLKPVPLSASSFITKSSAEHNWATDVENGPAQSKEMHGIAALRSSCCPNA